MEPLARSCTLVLLLALTHIGTCSADEKAKTYSYTIEVCHASVPCGECRSTEPVAATFSVSPATGVVLLTLKDSGGTVHASALQACKLADASNWVCGGETEPQPGGERTPSYSMSQGRLAYVPSALAQRIAPTQRYCYFQDGLLTRRLVVDTFWP